MCLINCLTTPNIQNKCPYEILFQKAPKYESHRDFDCLWYLWLKPYAKNKLEPKSSPCVYLGFSNNYYCHQCFDLIKTEWYLSRDVQFLEDTYPFHNIFSNLKNQQSTDSWEICSDVLPVTNKPSSFDSCHTLSDALPMYSPLPNSMPARSEGVSVASCNSQTLSSPSLPHTITPPPDNTQPPPSPRPLITY